MSRNGNGDYTLPLNDVETGTTISSVWANTTMEDIATALTNSLSRNANGGMNAPLRHSDGTVNAPSLSFNTETNTGIYRVTTGEYRFCVNGKDKLRVIDVDGMPAVQVYSNIAPIGWQTLGTASDIAGLTLQKVLQQGDRSLGENIVMDAGSVGPSYLSTIAFDGTDAASAEAHIFYQNNALRVLSGKGLVFTTDTTGANSNISLTSAGNVNITTATGFAVLNPSAGSNLGVTAGGGAVLIAPGSTAFPTPQALFTDGADIQLLTNVDVTGTVTAEGVNLGNNQKIVFGAAAGGSLEISETAAGSALMRQIGSGDFVIRGQIGFLQNEAGNSLLQWATNDVALYWRGTSFGRRLITTEAGIDVTGTVDCDGLKMDDGEFAQFGTGNDLKIWHSGTNSFIQDSGTGQLVLTTTNGLGIYIESAGESMGQFISNGAVNLYHDGVQKFATTSTGINVTGKVECTNTVAITTTGSGVDPAPDLDFINLHADAIGERLGQINYYGMNDESGSGTGQTKYAWTEVRTIDVTEDSEKAQHETWIKNGASHTRVLTVEPTGIDVTGTVDLDNLTISADQGTVGQVLTSTGSGIEWGAGGAGGEETLAQTLAFGNTTGGTDLAITTGDAITSPTDANLVIQGTGQTENYVQFGAGGQLEVSFDGGGTQITENDIGASPLAIQGREVQINLTFEEPRMGTSKPVLAGSTSTVLLFNDADMNVSAFGNDGLDWCWFDTGANRSNAQILSATTDGTTATITLVKPLSGNNVPTAGDKATCGGRRLEKRFSAGGSTGSATAECGLYSGNVAVDDEDAYSLQTRAATGITLGGVVNTGNATIGTDANYDVINIKRGETLDSGQETQIKGGLRSDKLVKLQSADILNDNLGLEYGKRIINTATTVTTYAIPNAGLSTFAGNSVVICNPTNKTITLDSDGNFFNVAQWVWILDGVTLMARNGDWQIKAGGVVELIAVNNDAGGGSQTAPNWVIFGAGILAI